MTGKILSISKSIDGLVIRNEDLEGKVSGLEIDVNGFRTYVEEKYVTGDTFEEYRSESKQTAKDITDKFESLDRYRNETQAHIKTGLLSKDGDPPVYGIEVGQTTKNADGVETFNKYAQFTSDRLSFFDQSDNEVTAIGDKMMFVTNIEITGSSDAESKEYGTFKHGKFVDIAQADGTIVSKWVGGS